MLLRILGKEGVASFQKRGRTPGGPLVPVIGKVRSTFFFGWEVCNSWVGSCVCNIGKRAFTQLSGLPVKARLIARRYCVGITKGL